jgi:hypothetical protein
MKSRNLLSNPTQKTWVNRLENRFISDQQRPSLKMYGLILSLFCLVGFSTSVQAQCELACRQYAPVVLDMAGEATISPATVLNNYPDPDCPGTILINVSTMQGLQLDTLVNCDYAGDTLMIVATHLGSGNQCWGSVVIRDEFKPWLNCPDVYVACTDSLIPDSVGYPGWIENCTNLTNIDFDFTDLYTNLPCSTVVNGEVVTGKVGRSWTVADASGNVGTCQQTIWLRTGTIEDVVFPLDRDGFAAPALNCNQNAKDLQLTGQPTIDGYPLYTLGHCDFVVDTFDNNYAGCIGGAYITVRTWRLIDYCADTTIYHAQVIHKVDNQAPVLIAPGDITIGTSAKTCDAPVYLPTSWTASDNCSSFSVTANWAYGEGFGPFLKVPKGIYEVIYQATDACGNIGADTLTLTIIDDDKPTAVCKKDVNIALPSSGIITVPASLFDDGSYDNCELDHLEVSRDNQPFGLTATFTCNDIGKNIMVVLKAIDKVGLSNTCMMLVQIQDKLAPVINCPNDITVACTTDIKNLNITGVAIGTDNCQMKSVTYVDTKFLNQCLTGYVNRIWSAEDIYGNKSGCLQVITLRDTTPITVVWPQNFTSFTCGQDISPLVTGEPIITGKDCENLFVTYVDKVYKTAYPACYRIERCWEIKEWCTYNPNQNPNPGHWLAVQYIDVLDNVAPVLQIPADITIGTDELGCYGTLDIPAATAQDCNPLTQIFHNSIYATAQGPSINGAYPIGEHSIMFTAVDGCGNNSMSTMKVTVVDDKPPLAICNNGVSIGLNMNGVAILPVLLIDNHSMDNCTPYQGLSFSIFPNTFNCDSIGPHEVTLTVIDDKGNANTCTTIVIVQDNLNICPSGVQAEIYGKVSNNNGLPVKGVEVLLNGLDLEITNDLGEFGFGQLTQGSNYTLTPELDKNPSNGISVADIIALQKHITGKKIITDPYMLIAGDVNVSGAITISDIIEVRKLLLGQQTGFSQVPSWQFVASDYTFKNPKKPTQEPFPKEILIENINGIWTNQNFIAIKSGDVNSTAQLENITNTEVRSTFETELWMEDQILEPGFSYRIPVRVQSSTPITGIQWQLNLRNEQVQLTTVEPGGCATASPEMLRMTPSDLRMVWHNPLPDPAMGVEPIVYFQVESTQRVRLSEVLHLDHVFTSEAIDQDGENGNVTIRFTQPETISSILLEPVVPNPFNLETTATFNLEKASPVTLRVFNAIGQEVWKHEADYSQGRHQEIIPGATLGRTGTYLLLIETPHTRPVSQTLVLIDE